MLDGQFDEQREVMLEFDWRRRDEVCVELEFELNDDFDEVVEIDRVIDGCEFREEIM